MVWKERLFSIGTFVDCYEYLINWQMQLVPDTIFDWSFYFLYYKGIMKFTATSTPV